MKEEIMKKILLFILAIAAVIVFMNDHTAAQEKKTYNYTDFSQVSVGWGMHISVSQGSGYFIEVEADKRDFEVLRVVKKGNTLDFTIDKSNYRKRSDINITVKMPVLSGISLSGGSICKINMNIASKDFEGEFSGGSELKGTLQCGNISFDCSGGSTITLNGKGKNLNADGSGGSIFNLKDFTVNDINADLSGGSSVTITTNGTINSEQSGGSQLVYYGKAKMGHTDFSGGSGISKGH
jgi:hypothetical protein